MTHLPPCPHCGGAALNVGFDFITCGGVVDRDCIGHSIQEPTDTNGDTSAAWNNRSRLMALHDQTISDLKKWVGVT